MVYRQTLKKLPKTLLMLAVVSALLFHVLLYVIDPGVVADACATLPDAVKTAVGMPSALNMRDPFAYILRISQVVYLVLCIFFLFSGAGIVRKHQKKGLMEFFLARKTTRQGYYMSLWSYGLTVSLLASLLFAGLTLLYLSFGGTDPRTVWGTCLYLGLRCGVVWMTLYAVGLCFGALCREKAAARFWAFLVFLVLYVCGVLSALLPPVWFLSFGALYHAAIPETVIFDGIRLLWQTLPVPAVLLLASGFGGIAALRRRDLEEEIGG